MKIAQGYSMYSVATEWMIPYHSLIRHRKEHILTGNSPAGPVVLTLRDVLDIPLGMRERKQLIDAMIMRLLEPLMNPRNKALQHGLEWFQGGIVARLLKIQQTDEQTILKLTGLLYEDAPGRGDLVVTEQYNRIRASLDARLLELAGGNEEEAAKARIQLANLLVPLEEMPETPAAPFTYTDLGPVPYEERSNGNTGNGSQP